MNVVWSTLIIIAAVTVAVTAILVVRRRAPDGGFFHDGDRAAGMFGVLATGFALLLGLIVVLAFTSYDESRSGAETEALLVNQQFETAQFMAAPASTSLGDQLMCYARSVVHQEWPRMEDGSLGDALNPWGIEMFDSLRTVDPESASGEAAYSKWLDQTSDREAARNDRIHGAVGVIPGPLWLVLLLIAGVILVFMMFFADSGERAVVQGIQVGAVVAVITATLLLIVFLDSPYRPGFGGLRPVAMERALRILEEERAAVGSSAPLPCDEQGVATP